MNCFTLHSLVWIIFCSDPCSWPNFSGLGQWPLKPYVFLFLFFEGKTHKVWELSALRGKPPKLLFLLSTRIHSYWGMRDSEGKKQVAVKSPSSPHFILIALEVLRKEGTRNQLCLGWKLVVTQQWTISDCLFWGWFRSWLFYSCVSRFKT